jgi:hypothetical protein
MTALELIAQIVAMLGAIGTAAVAIWRWMARSIEAARKEAARLNEARVAQAELYAAQSAAMVTRYERITERLIEVIRAQKVTLDARDR